MKFRYTEIRNPTSVQVWFSESAVRHEMFIAREFVLSF
jgi:hypothetical protein